MSISGGAVTYYRTCDAGTMVWVNDTPDPVTFLTEFAGGIAAGGIVEYFRTSGNTPAERIAVPTAVYADKQKKKLVNWMGFAY